MRPPVASYKPIATAAPPTAAYPDPQHSASPSDDGRMLHRFTAATSRFAGASLSMGSVVGPLVQAQGWARTAALAKPEHSPLFASAMAEVEGYGRWALATATAGTALYCAGTMLSGKARRAVIVGTCASAALVGLTYGLLFEEPECVRGAFALYSSVAMYQLFETISFRG